MFVEIVNPDAPTRRVAVGSGRNTIRAQAGARYRVVIEPSDVGERNVVVKRLGNDLLVDGLPDERLVEFEDFFTRCTPERACTLSMQGLGGTPLQAIGPASEPVGTLPDGSQVMFAAGQVPAAEPLPAAEGGGGSFKSVAAGLAGLALIGAAGGGGGKGGGGSATEVAVPHTPTVTSSKTSTAATPVIAGTADPGAKISVFLDLDQNGTPDVTYSTTAAADGTWSVDTASATPVVGALPVGGLATGSVVLVSIRSAIGSGVSELATTSISIVPVIVPQAIAIAQLLDDQAPVTGAVVAGGASNDATPTLSGTLAAPLVAGEAVHVLRDGVVVGTASVTGTQWTYTEPTAVADGTHAYVARVDDAAGHASATSAARSVVIDSAAPARPTLGTIAGDDVVTSGEAAAGVTVGGTAEAGATVALTWGTTTHTAVAGPSGAFSAVFAAAELPAPGAGTVSAVATDAAGNAGSAATHAVTISGASLAAPTIATVAGNDIVSAAEATAGVTVSGTAIAGSIVTVGWGALSKVTTATVGGTYSVLFAVGEVPASGSTSVSAVASDGAGHASDVIARPVLVDRVAPAVPTIAAVAGDDTVSYPEKAAGVVVSGTAEANASVTVVFGSATHTVAAAANGAYTTTFASGEVPADGARTVTAFAVDAAGNTGLTASHAVTVNTAATTYTGTAAANTLTLTKVQVEDLAAPGAGINGAGGTDVLQFSGSGITLDLTTLLSTTVTSFERVNITGSGNNTLTLNLADVLQMGTANVFNNGSGWTGLGGNVAQRQVVIDGNAGDVVNASGGWTHSVTQISNGGHVYDVYTTGSGASNGMLLIDTVITRNVI